MCGLSWCTVSVKIGMGEHSLPNTVTNLTSPGQMMLITAKEMEIHSLNYKTKMLILTARAANVINTPVRKVR